jgi:hypothetical protein
MGFNEEDTIVSWLPLYHDMGFVACFITALMKNIPLVLIDAMDWIRNPKILYSAIEKYSGTICYMPNFSFELMSSLPCEFDLSSMRHWISCSEPTYPDTIRRFAHSCGAQLSTISTCYGMAENIFAVTQSNGFKTVMHDGAERISCGNVISGTAIKVVDGEIYVRSPYSLVSYDWGLDIRDTDGYYPTGDMGFIEDSELVITGRKLDIINCAGKKFFLNDIDFVVNDTLKSARGRLASLGRYDPQLGTEIPLVLVEHPTFWNATIEPTALREIAERTGFEQVDIRFVPPRFITKTSSGKVNRRKTLQDYQACLDQATSKENRQKTSSEIENEIRQFFSAVPFDQPIEEHVDSLGRVILKSILEENGIQWDPSQQDISIANLIDKINDVPSSNSGRESISIVCIGDKNQYLFLNQQLIDSISAKLNLPITFEHVCMPPSSILLSDLIFHDYFMPRDADQGKYSAFSACIQKLKNATLILVDDINELHFPINASSVYPKLSHSFSRDPMSELLAVRWARYTSQHHLLASELVVGSSIEPKEINNSLDFLSQYLNCPLMRIGLSEDYSEHTRSWEFLALHSKHHHSKSYASIDVVEFILALASNLHKIALDQRLKFAPVTQLTTFEFSDQPHFCSWLINPAAVDQVVKSYNSFCICGLSSSIPYLSKILNENKRKEIEDFFKNYKKNYLIESTGTHLSTQKVKEDLINFLYPPEDGYEFTEVKKPVIVERARFAKELF